jgi:hypothetical protein
VCSVSGVLYSETFHEGPLSASVVFGAIEDQTSNFQQFYVIDGVLGMAYATLSSWGGLFIFSLKSLLIIRKRYPKAEVPRSLTLNEIKIQ